VDADTLAEQYRRLVGHALAGEIQVDVERIGLDDVAVAWDRAGKRIVCP
jgi:hypothetical protein